MIKKKMRYVHLPIYFRTNNLVLRKNVIYQKNNKIVLCILMQLKQIILQTKKTIFEL